MQDASPCGVSLTFILTRPLGKCHRMATTLKDLGPTEKEIHVAVPQTDIQAALDKSFNELRKQIVLPGFRAGKVPRGILERRFGDQVRGEVWQELVQEGIQDAMKEHELEPVSEPKLKDLPGGHDHDHDHEGEDHEHDHEPKELLPKEGDFEFSFSVEIKADFELPKYRGLSATRKIKQVADSDIEEVLKNVADRRAEWMPVEDENAVVGETDLIAGMATLGTGERVVLDDSPISFMPQTSQLGDFTVENLGELVEGKKVDDEITLDTVIVPDDYEEEVLRGMTLKGKVVIDAIKRQVSPAMDDELAKAMGMDDLEAFKKDIQENLVKQHERLADRDVVSQILDQLVEKRGHPVGSRACGSPARTPDPATHDSPPN